MTEATNTTPADVLIIGAGPAGLTSGYLLGKAGRSVQIIERDPERARVISEQLNTSARGCAGVNRQCSHVE